MQKNPDLFRTDGVEVPSSPGKATQILIDLQGGDESALDRLMPLVYEDLRALAKSYLRRRRPDDTLETTALVHEAYLRLVHQEKVDWKSRSHFFAAAAQAIRHILVDHARARGRAKRGGAWRRVTLDEAVAITERRDVDVLALDEALNKLASLDHRQSRVVESRFFGGLTIEEVGCALGVSPRTVNDDWTVARAWLRRELHRGD